MPPVDQVFCVVTKVVPTPSFLERAGLDVASQPCRISWRRQRSSFKVNHVKYLMLLKFLPQSHVLTGCSEYLSSAQRKNARSLATERCVEGSGRGGAPRKLVWLHTHDPGRSGSDRQPEMASPIRCLATARPLCRGQTADGQSGRVKVSGPAL